MKTRKIPLRKSVVSNEVMISVICSALSKIRKDKSLSIRQARPTAAALISS